MWVTRRQPTYTLTEVIVVLAILAILASMAIPRFGQASVRYRADAAASRVIADLEHARQRACQVGAGQLVSFDVPGDSYQLNGMPDPDRPGQDYVVNLADEPYRAQILSVDFSAKTQVSFDGYGMPDDGGTIVIAVGDWKRTITVDPDTGEAYLP